MQWYTFNIQVEGEALVVMTSLVIVNIDDNRPMINVFEPCQAAVSSIIYFNLIII